MLAEEDLPHIFERFYWSPAACVARANDGTLAVQASEQGSTFSLTFPPAESA